MPKGHITVGISPAYMRKAGSGFDLPMAMGILFCSGQLYLPPNSKIYAEGELSLGGDIIGTPGSCLRLKTVRDMDFDYKIIPESEASSAGISCFRGQAVSRLTDLNALFEGGQYKEASFCYEKQESENDYIDISNLKGQEKAKRALLISAAARPTKDIDFLGDKISRNKETIRKAFREICSIQCPEDGLAFDNGENDIKVEDISLDNEYNGVTVTVTAHLDTIVQPFSMDIGFGDIVVPEPQELDYPLLLDDMPEVSINAYSLETVVAEKFQTMIDRALANSRMKDFYDVYSILSSESENLKVNEDILTEAIAAVFSNRGTIYIENHPLFNGEFKNNPDKQTQWNAFLKKMKFKGVLPLNEVVDYITEKLYPYWLSLKK